MARLFLQNLLFWAETAKEQGKQVQTELVKAEGGKVATIVTKNDWVGPDGAKLLSDVIRAL